MPDPTVMIVGVGDLGGVVLEFLVRCSAIGRVVAADLDAERGQARCNLARIGAITQGYDPVVEFCEVDIDRPETVAAAIERYHPDLILSTATRQAWWLANLLPPEPSALLARAKYGPWLPINLTLTLKLMQTLRDVAYRGITLTAPYPDVINPILDRLGLAPTCGVSNVDEIVPKIRYLAAKRLGERVDAVKVYLVAHHALLSAAFGEATGPIPPYFLRVEGGGEDVTESVEADRLLLEPYPIPPGRVTHFLTAGSIVKLIEAFFSDEPAFLHAPAPNALPGGYPILASRRGVAPASIPGLSLVEAIDINQRSHVFDGVERIEEDGTVVFSPESVEVFRDALGYSCERLPPGEAEDRAAELMSRFREFARRHGVDVDNPAIRA